MRGLGIVTIGIVLASCLPASAVEKTHKSHCRPDETSVFTCPIRGKTVSLCASSERSFSAGALQYRFGRIGKIELSYPDKPIPPIEAFTGGLALYGYGGSSYVRFTQAGVTYTLYRYSGIGHQEDGLVVTHGERKLLVAKCPNFADVDDDWWLKIDKGALTPDPDEPVVP